MSKPETYTAVLRFPVPITDGHKAQNPCTGEIQTAQQWLAFKKEKAARKWLADNGHERPLIVYDNCDPTSTAGEIAVVLNDRDTALLLKLAMN